MFLTTFTILTATLSAPLPPDAGNEVRLPFEKKLIGEWVNGGHCVGSITIRADGTYERRHYSPGDATLSGKWSVRWDAMPPTLVLKCDKASHDSFVGETQEMTITRLDEKAMHWGAEGESAGTFSRKRK